MAKSERFENVYSQGKINITPLLDRDGKPVISPIEQKY